MWLAILATTAALLSAAVFLIRRQVEEQNRLKDLEEENIIKNYRKQLKDMEPIDVSTLALPYQPWETEALGRFSPCKEQTRCVFAKKSQLWSVDSWKQGETLEEFIARHREVLSAFYRVGLPNHLDGFLIEIKGEEYFADLECFGNTVSRVLNAFTEGQANNCMKKTYIGKRGWFFEYDENPTFVTTFCPLYPPTNSRFQYGIQGYAYILLQPEYSFAWHNLPPDTPHTNWDDPQTSRDRIRVEFKNAGQPYEIPESVVYSMAHHMVPGINLGDEPPHWWESKPTN